MTDRYTAEDVTVRDSNEVVIERAQDVYVEGQVGTLKIVTAEDVVISGSGPVTVEQSQDVVIEDGTIEGDINVTDAEAVVGADDADVGTGAGSEDA